MKKYLVLFVVLALMCALCACKSGDENVTNPAVDPTATSGSVNEPAEKVTIDWETPIDVDDSFIDDSTDPIDKPTDPSDETGPLTTVDPTYPTDGSEDPTEAAPTTDPTENPTEADPTEPEVIPTKGTGSSGAIELPMIPG